MKKLLTTIVLLISCGGIVLGQTMPHYSQIKGAPIVDVRQFGSRGDGVTDDLPAMQAAVNSGSIYVPPGTYRFGGNLSLDIPSNRIVMFAPGATVKLLPHNNSGGYQMLRVHQKENVFIYGGLLDGNRDENSATTGEFGMGVSIRSSNNVVVENTIIQNTWGDGIYVGSWPNAPGSTVPTGIVLRNIFIDNCRRMGVTFISAKNLLAEKIHIKNIQGTPPQAGIDFEPNHTTEKLWNLTFRDITIEDVAGHGIDFLWKDKTSAVKVLFDTVRIVGGSIGISNGGYFGATPVTEGYEDAGVLVRNVTIKDNRYNAISNRKHNANSFPVVYEDVTIINNNTSGVTDDNGAAVRLIRTSEEESTGLYPWPIGNIHVRNLTLDAASASFIFYVAGQGSGLSNVSFIDPSITNADSANTDSIRSFVQRTVMKPSAGLVFSNVNRSYPLPRKILIGGDVSSSQDHVEQILYNLNRNGLAWGYGVTGFKHDYVPLSLVLTSTTLRRQILLSRVYLPWVSISAEAPNVEIVRSQMTRNFPGTQRPAIGFLESVPPSIALSLSFDTSDRPTDLATGTLNIFSIKGSRGVKLAGTYENHDGRAIEIKRSYVDIAGVIASGSTEDIRISEGSVVKAGGATGTVAGGVVDNTPSVSGLFMR